MSMLKEKLDIKNRTTPKVINSGSPSIIKKEDKWVSIKSEKEIEVETMNFADWKKNKSKT